MFVLVSSFFRFWLLDSVLFKLITFSIFSANVKLSYRIVSYRTISHIFQSSNSMGPQQKLYSESATVRFIFDGQTIYCNFSNDYSS